MSQADDRCFSLEVAVKLTLQNLSSIVDTSGTLRVQYMGVRFAPDEFLRDLQSLLPEGNKR
jgi:hypothetical protein